MSGKMTSLKTEEGSWGGLRVYRGPITPERTKELRGIYEEAGWKLDPLPTVLSFVSPCGRWFDCYDTATSQFYRIDGEWRVNLVQTKGERDEIGNV